MTARKRTASATSLEFEAILNNRSRWPARSTTNLSVRIYFKLEPGVRPDEVTFSLKEGHAQVSKIHANEGSQSYVELSFPNEDLYPGTAQSSRRSVRISVVAPRWDPADDWSLKRLTPEWRLLPELPVYEQDHRLSGIEPGSAASP